MRGRVVGVVGGQWGSEAKGLVVAKIADDFGIHVRTGGPNAGHTFWHPRAEKFYVGRSIPCGWVNETAALVIGAGAVVDLDVLIDELNEFEEDGHTVAGRLYMDYNAGIITPAQHHYEGGVDGYAHENIGSTGEGVGICRIAKISRNSVLPVRDSGGTILAHRYERASDHSEYLESIGVTLVDTAKMLNDAIDDGVNVLLEGTQGSGLSLTHGQWPYCTSADTNVGQLAVDAGISPSLVDETIIVCRTYPIRVAGNSGPMGEEISFADLGVEEETTTVTKKVRRIARWSDDVVRKAVMLNRPAKLVITFMNYHFPDHYATTEWGELSPNVKTWVADIERRVGAPVAAVSFDRINLIERSKTGLRFA